MRSQRPKRQHYVPRFYLNNFADAQGLVWTYDVLTDEVRAGSSENTAVQTNFYSTVDENGEHLDLLEDWLAGVEAKAAPIYPKLLRGEFLMGQERADMAVFFSSLFTRSPALITSAAEVVGYMAQHASEAVLQDRNRLEVAFDRMDQERGQSTPADMRDAVFEFAKDKTKFIMEVDRKAGLMAMLGTDKLTDLFFRMTWIVVGSEHQHLITSDSPLTRVSPSRSDPLYGDGGFLNKEMYATVPLTPTRLLEMSWKEKLRPGVYSADKQRARLYNRQRAHFSERYLYASQQDSGVRALGKKFRAPGVRMVTSGADALAPVMVRRQLRSR